MSLDLGVAMLVRDPPMDRLAALIDFTSAIASEFILVDTGSSKEDLAAMASWNKGPWGLPKVQIIQKQWPNNFAIARNYGVDAITRKWTLILDPDELPSTRMMEHVRAVVGTNTLEPTGYLYFTRDYYGGRRDPEADYQWHVRLWKTGHGKFYRALDELVELDGLDEQRTRNTSKLPKAPKDAYLIHSKSSYDTERSRNTYDTMRQAGTV